MFYLVPIFLSVVTSVQPAVPAADARLSPPMLEKPASTKVELPELLADRHVIDDPVELLRTLQVTQQKAFEELKTIKARAWYQFYANNGTKPMTWLVDSSYARKPEQLKELKFNSNKMMEEAKAGRKYQPVGVDANDKDAWSCLNARISNPRMTVFAQFLKHMRPGNIQMLTIFEAGHNSRSPTLAWDTIQFGFASSPSEFYRLELPRILEAGGTLTVRRDGDLVELDITDPTNKRTPRTIYRFDLSKNGSAVAKYDRSQNRVTEFQNKENVWVPVSLKEQNISRYLEMTFFDSVVNAELEDEEFSLKSLPMSEDTVVNDKRVTPSTRTFFRDWEE